MTELVCIVYPRGYRLRVDEKNRYKVTGNSCPRGEVYDRKELVAPTHAVISTVKIRGASTARASVKAGHEVLKKDTFTAMHLLGDVTLQTPMHAGDIVAPNLLGLGVNFVITYGLTKVLGAG